MKFFDTVIPKNKGLTMYPYRIDSFSYPGPSGILGSEGKQMIPLKPVRGGLRIIALSISSHELTQ